MKFTSLTLLIAAVAGTCFSQAAYAGNTMRFDYAPNEFALDQTTGHHGGRYAAPHAVVPTVAAGAVPKNHMLDNDFVSRPAPPSPPPVVAAVPSVSSKVTLPKSFASLLNPVRSDAPQPLVAKAPGQLPDFGKPIAQSLPAATTPKAPAIRTSTNTAIAWTHPHHKPVAAIAAAPAFAMPAIMHHGGGYQAGNGVPLPTSKGSSASTAVTGQVIHK